VDRDAAGDTGRRIEVVYVEDEPDTLELMTIVLERYGWRVRPAASSEAARELIALRVPDAVLTGLRMQGNETGWVFARRLRAEERTRHLVLLALSGSVTEPNVPEPPFDAMVAKPAITASLVALVSRLVGARRRARGRGELG
jgi:CheY-like chemotaxis protein